MIVLGGILFWAITAADALIVISYCRKEAEGLLGATVWLCLLLVIFWIFGNFNPFVIIYDYVVANSIHTVCWVLGYLVTGVVWSLYRWLRLCRLSKKEYNHRKKEWLRAKGVNDTEIPERLLEEWRGNIRRSREYNYGGVIPKAMDHKRRITTWMAYWPFSISIFFFEDFLIGLFNRIYGCFTKIFQKIADSTFKDVKDELGQVDED